MEVRKSDNSVEEYSTEKIRHGVKGAFEAVGKTCDEVIIDFVLHEMRVYDNITTSEIRKQIEHVLMDIDKDAAHAYIETYDKITADNVAIAKKQDFITQYLSASNAATGSKFDANANVER